MAPLNDQAPTPFFALATAAGAAGVAGGGAARWCGARGSATGAPTAGQDLGGRVRPAAVGAAARGGGRGRAGAVQVHDGDGAGGHAGGGGRDRGQLRRQRASRLGQDVPVAGARRAPRPGPRRVRPGRAPARAIPPAVRGPEGRGPGGDAALPAAALSGDRDQGQPGEQPLGRDQAPPAAHRSGGSRAGAARAACATAGLAPRPSPRWPGPGPRTGDRRAAPAPPRGRR